MPTLNLGILAHVDAGKTTLTERLLYETGATRHLGRVDHGDTTTDSDSIERRRGITIRTAVATMTLPSPRGPVKVNLIDTPGHSDFVAEVERALAVLDGAVLVVSAVEGVQAQTRVLIRILERLGLPFLVFANKMDRAGASLERTLDALREELPGTVVALAGPMSGPASVEEVLDAVAPWDDRLLRAYVDGARPPGELQALAALAEQARLGHVHPVVSGAALAGVGIGDVLAAITTYLPTVESEEAEPLHATVFKIDRDADGHRVAYLRLHEGRLASRDHVTVHRRLSTGVVATHDARAVDVRAFDRGAETRAGSAVAGDIATVVGLGEVTIGDQLGRWDAARSGRQFPPPGLESVVQPRDPAERIELFQALQQLSEQDPLIDARLDGVDQEITVDVYGEVQKEVLAARLEADYGVAADFLPTRTVHIERVAGTGEAADRTAMGNASLALRVEPAPVGTGLRLRARRRRRARLPAALVPRRDRGDAGRRAGSGALRLAGHRPPGAGRALEVPRADPLGRRVPQADRHDVPSGPAAGRDHGLRARQPVRAGHARRVAALRALGARGRRSERRAGRGRHLPLPGHRHHPHGRGRRVRTTAARPHLRARLPHVRAGRARAGARNAAYSATSAGRIDEVAVGSGGIGVRLDGHPHTEAVEADGLDQPPGL